MFSNTARYHLVPVEQDWGVRQEGRRIYECIFGDRDAALREARRLAHEHRGILVLHDQGGRTSSSIDFSEH